MGNKADMKEYGQSTSLKISGTNFFKFITVGLGGTGAKLNKFTDLKPHIYSLLSINPPRHDKESIYQQTHLGKEVTHYWYQKLSENDRLAPHSISWDIPVSWLSKCEPKEFRDVSSNETFFRKLLYKFTCISRRFNSRCKNVRYESTLDEIKVYKGIHQLKSLELIFDRSYGLVLDFLKISVDCELFEKYSSGFYQINRLVLPEIDKRLKHFHDDLADKRCIILFITNPYDNRNDLNDEQTLPPTVKLNELIFPDIEHYSCHINDLNNEQHFLLCTDELKESMFFVSVLIKDRFELYEKLNNFDEAYDKQIPVQFTFFEKFCNPDDWYKEQYSALRTCQIRKLQPFRQDLKIEALQCIDPEKNWADRLDADATDEEISAYFEHAEHCQYHREIIELEDKKTSQMLRHFADIAEDNFTDENIFVGNKKNTQRINEEPLTKILQVIESLTGKYTMNSYRSNPTAYSIPFIYQTYIGKETVRYLIICRFHGTSTRWRSVLRLLGLLEIIENNHAKVISKRIYNESYFVSFHIKLLANEEQIKIIADQFRDNMSVSTLQVLGGIQNETF